jgi:carbon monoxide dehydrogenase subunit G
MNLSGTIAIAAPAREVWDVIVDPAELSACVAGVRELRAVDDRTFEGSIRAGIGPIDGDFAFTAVIERASYPDDLVVRVSGVDSVTKSTLQLDATAAVAGTDGGTSLRYDASVAVKGRLAILGEMVLRATAGMMIQQVTNCLRDRLETRSRETRR